MTSPINGRNATSADFERSAQEHANAFWVWAIITGIVALAAVPFAVIPGVLAFVTVLQYFSATTSASQLRAGTYSIPNHNNGRPDSEQYN